MKKQKFCYAAVTACVGLCSLGSCTQEEMAYQGEEEDISKLKVITRTDDESSKPVEGKIYIFNQNNVCIDTISSERQHSHTNKTWHCKTDSNRKQRPFSLQPSE